MQALSAAEFRELARQKLAGDIWDFIEGGAGDEQTLRENTSAFSDVRLRPRVLTGVRQAALSLTVLGRQWAAPIGVAPMAYHTLAHPDGEYATVRGAGSLGLPVVLSTFSGTPLDELGAVAKAPLWLQLYCLRDWTVTERLLARAADAGCEAVVLTVDTPRLGRRLRDVRNGFRLPPSAVPVNLPMDAEGFADPSAHSRTALLPGMSWSTVRRLREISPLPLVLKGILTAEDARLAVAGGVDAVIVSNHGGRQLDGARSTLAALPEVASAVAGRCPVLLDGGVRRGRDVAAALALGADAVFVGRPVLHALTVDGEQGVRDLLGLLVDELADTMVLAGKGNLAALGTDLLTGPVELSPPAAPHAEVVLAAESLHASLRDPLLDTMNFLNEITARHPSAISFGPGRPHEEHYDVEQLFADLRGYIDGLVEGGADAEQVRTALFQYGPTAGQIRQDIARMLLLDEGITVSPESIVTTVGCQEAMFLVLRALFAGPRDVLLVPTPCYVGITGAARLLDVPVVPLPETGGGLSAAGIRAAAAAERSEGRAPRAVYVVPDMSNPSGNTMSLAGRRELLEAAAREELLVIEDSPYRLLTTGERLPTLKALDTGRRVVHLGSLSKTGFPGARVGFAVADQEVRGEGGSHLLADDLARIKSMITVNTPSLSQAAVGGLLRRTGGALADAVRPAAAHYGRNVDRALDALERHFPPTVRDRLGVSWNRPDGGFFLSLRLPFPADADLLRRSAEHYGVIWTPMRYFHVGTSASPECENSMRLSVSSLSADQVDRGIGALARLVEDEAARRGGERGDVC